jgi:geranylgeranyl diphosphate synthase type II
MHSIEELREIFTAYFEKETTVQEPVNLYEPNHYFLQIGGKRLRPCLVLLASELFGGNADDALPAALGIEYFHNFTLIHDDVMDDAPVRRGMRTLHQKYNLNTAILSGDVLLIKAFESFIKTNSIHLKKILDIYVQTAVEVCEGQQYDMDFEKREKVTHDEYIEMIRLKSAVLLGASLKIGAIIGNASDKNAELLYTYGESLGIAFQIQDDILDCYGDNTLVGKQLGGDIVQNKKTLLLIEALSKNDPRLQEWTSNNNHSNTEKVNAVLEIYNDHGIKEYAIQQRDEYVQKAMKVLSEMEIAENKKEILKGLADYLVVRTF